MLRGDLGPELQAQAESRANNIHVKLLEFDDRLVNEGRFFRDRDVWAAREWENFQDTMPRAEASSVTRMRMSS
jgi:hypothetical protein